MIIELQMIHIVTISNDNEIDILKLYKYIFIVYER